MKIIKKLARLLLITTPQFLAYHTIIHFKCFECIKETIDSPRRITFTMWLFQKVIGINRGAYWPMHITSQFKGRADNVSLGVMTFPGYRPGCYIQAVNKIHVGDYTRIAPNVGLISSNHALYIQDAYENNIKGEGIYIGKYCWIGMNSIVLPGVKLGDFTKVGAGSVVTKSFPEGHCVVAGNPARLIKQLDKEKCVRFKEKHEFVGYKKVN